MREGQDLFSITTGVLEGMKEILDKEQPDMVLVHGDTTTTFAAALAAFIVVFRLAMWKPVYVRVISIRLIRRMNRSLAGRICELHFAPTDTAGEFGRVDGQL